MPPTDFLAPVGWPSLLLRLGCSLLIGTIVGLEREVQSKPAGLRTNMLVSFGSAILVLVPIEIGAAQQSVDALSRTIQGVVTGVGFIGAGTILRGERVKGLTTAAATWVTASLGIAAGCGLWQLGLLGAIVTWLILWLVDKFENRFF